MERPWIEHDGSGCPFPPETVLEIRFRDGEVRVDSVAETHFGNPYAPEVSLWIHEPDICALGRAAEVVAYRLASDPDAEAKRERYAAIFDDMIKTAPVDVPVRLPESEPA